MRVTLDTSQQFRSSLNDSLFLNKLCIFVTRDTSQHAIFPYLLSASRRSLNHRSRAIFTLSSINGSLSYVHVQVVGLGFPTNGGLNLVGVSVGTDADGFLFLLFLIILRFRVFFAFFACVCILPCSCLSCDST